MFISKKLATEGEKKMSIDIKGEKSSHSDSLQLGGRELSEKLL